VSLLVEWNKKGKTMRFETGKDYYADYDVNTFFGIANLQHKITKDFVDVDLLDAAVFWFTNVERKRFNLKQFQFYNKLRQTSLLHSEQMKRHNFFSHENAFDTRYKTLTDRINSVKDNSFDGFMSWGENISDYPIIEAGSFTIENRGGVIRLFSTNGKELFPYSYYEYAKVVVDGWMNSPGHRANILNPDYEYLGCGCVKYEKQGNGYLTLYFKLTQNFGGKLIGKINQSIFNPHTLENIKNKFHALLGDWEHKINVSNIMYTESFSRATPGLIIICVDQSSSMTDSYANSSKSEFAAIAVNRVISEIITFCTKGDAILDYCQVAVVGYGSNVSTLFNEKTSKLAQTDEFVTLKKKVSDGAGGTYDEDYTLQVFVKPIASGGTPMAEAFQKAYVEAEQFIQNNPNSFPPIVINITDGEPNDCNDGFKYSKSEAEKLKQLKTSDGNLILMNAHIANVSGLTLNLPNTKEAIQGNQYAEFLFDISSVLPEPLANNAKGCGFPVQDNARGFVFNADAETLVRFLNFGTKLER